MEIWKSCEELEYCISVFIALHNLNIEIKGVSTDSVL